MKIAEYKQISEEIVESIVMVDDFDSNGNIIGHHEETHRKVVPVMGMVYRDMTAEETAEAQKIELDEMTKAVEVTQEDKIKCLLDSVSVTAPADAVVNDDGSLTLPVKIGYRWEKIYAPNAVSFRLVADPNALGTSANPIQFIEGATPCIDNAFYTTADGRTLVGMGGEFVEM